MTLVPCLVEVCDCAANDRGNILSNFLLTYWLCRAGESKLENISCELNSISILSQVYQFPSDNATENIPKKY